MWQQLVSPNLNITYTGGECLKAVADAYGLSWDSPDRYAAAMLDWNANNRNHPGEQPPTGVAVPVYFSLTNIDAGHVAISLPDGLVASSTMPGVHRGFYIHPSLADLIAMYTNNENGICTYLGWSETVDRIQVVQGGTDVTQQEFDNAQNAWKEETAKNTVRLIADVIGGDPQYETTQPDVFQADVARLLGATQPLEDRRLGHDFWNDYGCKRKEEWQPEEEKLQEQIDTVDALNTDQMQKINDLQLANKGLKAALDTAQATIALKPDSQAAVAQAVNIALAEYRANPWPLVGQWLANKLKVR